MDEPVYVYDRAGWPAFTWDHSVLEQMLSSIHFRRAKLLTAVNSLGLELRNSTLLDVLVDDVRTSSEIEGVRLDADQVRSSVARRLGLEVAGLPEPERGVEGVVEMMLEATQRYDLALDEERLFAWHAALFPSGWSGLYRINVGRWRNDESGPMQVVSGPIGHERVHFQAPAADRLPAEMSAFIDWFEQGPHGDPILHAALAHLRFVTIHPFDDGNGRIARALTDMALARADQSSRRYYSVSSQILRHRQSYYSILERTQKGQGDVGLWLKWFLDRIGEALEAAEGVLALVDQKRRFWDAHQRTELNERQVKVLNLLLEGFRGKLQTSKYAKLAKCSPDTALRDLNHLVDLQILEREAAGGRSTHYMLRT